MDAEIRDVMRRLISKRVCCRGAERSSGSPPLPLRRPAVQAIPGVREPIALKRVWFVSSRSSYGLKERVERSVLKKERLSGAHDHPQLERMYRERPPALAAPKHVET